MTVSVDAAMPFVRIPDDADEEVFDDGDAEIIDKIVAGDEG